MLLFGNISVPGPDRMDNLLKVHTYHFGIVLPPISPKSRARTTAPTGYRHRRLPSFFPSRPASQIGTKSHFRPIPLSYRLASRPVRGASDQRRKARLAAQGCQTYTRRGGRSRGHPDAPSRASPGARRPTRCWRRAGGVPADPIAVDSNGVSTGGPRSRPPNTARGTPGSRHFRGDYGLCTQNSLVHRVTGRSAPRRSARPRAFRARQSIGLRAYPAPAQTTRAHRLARDTQ